MLWMQLDAVQTGNKPLECRVILLDALSHIEAQMNTIAKQIIFIGRVQGVGFRFTAFDIANRHQLTGYVRNLMDGSVEMIAQGSPGDISDCVRDIKETYGHSITETRIDEIPPDPSCQNFKITF